MHQKRGKMKNKEKEIIKCPNNDDIFIYLHRIKRQKTNFNLHNIIFNFIGFDEAKKICDFNKYDKFDFAKCLQTKHIWLVYRNNKKIELSKAIRDDKIIDLFKRFSFFSLNNIINKYKKIIIEKNVKGKLINNPNNNFNWKDFGRFLDPKHFAEVIYESANYALLWKLNRDNNKKFVISLIVSGFVAISSVIASIITSMCK